MKKTIIYLILLAWLTVGVSAAQAQSKLSALPSITSPADTDLLYVVKPGDPSPDRKFTIADLKTLIEGVIAVSPGPGDTAADITFAPAGNIAAVDVQAAIQELDTEKLSTSGTAALATALAANGTNCGAGEASTGVDASGNAEGCFTPAGVGSAPALDLGNDTINESAGLALVATTGDTNSIFSEPSADKLLIDVSKKWPIANTADALTANGANCGAGNAPLGVDAAGAVEGCFDVATQAELDAHTGATNAHSAVSTNTADRIVLRDGSGNFAAGIITATLSGNASTATTATNLAADGANCSAGQAAIGVDSAGASQGCFDVATQAELDAHINLTNPHSATALNTASRIVLRDGSGNFAAGSITANLIGSVTGNASTATALAANGANCTNQFPRGVDASGAVEGCASVAGTDIANNTVGPTQIDETANYDFTGKLSEPVAIASLPAAGTAGRLRWISDGNGVSCDSDGGSTYVLCYDNGSVWTPVSPVTTEADTLDTVFDRGKTIDGANSFANAVKVTDGTNGTAIYTHASNGPQIVCSIGGVENDCNYYRLLASGKEWGVKDSGGTARFSYTEASTIKFNADSTAEATGHDLGSATKAFQSAYFHGSGTFGSHSIQVTGAPTGNRVATLPDATDTLVGKATTDTLTNKTIDAEGTGNVITITEKKWFPFAACQNATASLIWDSPTSNAAAAACVTGTNTQKGVADFDATTDESLQMTYQLPSDFTGNIDARVVWLAAATSGAVGWCVQLVSAADAETDDPAFPAQGAGNCVSDTAKGTTLQLNHADITSVTATGVAAGELLHIRVSRDADGGAVTDSMTGDARGIGLELTYRRAM